MTKTRIVILGCGFGGLAAAQEFSRRRRDDLEITAFNRTPVLYNYPLLPHLLLEDLPERQLNWPLEQLLDPRRVRLRAERITAIDFDQQAVTTESSHHAFDYLVIVPGGKATPIEQDDGFTVYYPKAARHLLRLRAEIETLCTTHAATENHPNLLVVGGGLTGVEFAAAVRELLDARCKAHALDPQLIGVTLVEQAARLAPHCHPRLSETLQQQLSRRGIRVLTGLRVRRVHHDRVTTERGDLAAYRVVCCIGSGSDLRFEMRGLNPAARLLASDTLQLENHPRCFVAGDAAEPPPAPHQETKRASLAIHQGRAAARNVLRIIDGRPPLRYRTPRHPTLVTLDHRHATLEYRGLCCTGRWPARLKRFLETRYL